MAGHATVACGRTGLDDLVADLSVVKAPELRDRTRCDGRTLQGRPALEDRDRGHLVVARAADVQPVPRSDRAREQSGVHDLLAAGAAFDLEDRARDGAVWIAR